MYYSVIRHSGHSRTLKKCRKHSPVAYVLYISLDVLKCPSCFITVCTQLRLFYLLRHYVVYKLSFSTDVQNCGWEGVVSDNAALAGKCSIRWTKIAKILGWQLELGWLSATSWLSLLVLICLLTVTDNQ